MKRSTLFALLLVLFVLSMATMACDDGGELADLGKDVAQEPGKIYKEITGSMTGSPGKNTGFIGEPGKFLCESTGGRWVASIDACYEK